MTTKKLSVSTEVPNEIRMTRTFDAPRRLVIKAITTPELLKRWMGNSHGPMTDAQVDLRVGGTYRYEFSIAATGARFAFVGTYREIADDRLVCTQLMEGTPGEAVVTTTFVEANNKTTMTIAIAFPTQQIRDAVLATGMAEGAGESYDNLEALVTSL